MLSSSGYTEMSGWHEPTMFCTAACIFNVVWQSYPELNIPVCSENHSNKEANKGLSPDLCYTMTGEILWRLVG